MAPEQPPLGSDEQAMEAVRESNDAPQYFFGGGKNPFG
jgi:hypothetical protein